MSNLPDGLHELDLDEKELRSLRSWAALFDRLGLQVPSPTPYTATDFIDWLLLERRARSTEIVAERRRDDRRIRAMSRRPALAAG